MKVARSILHLGLVGAVSPQSSLTSLVNLFIGTASGANGGSGGNAFPGAAVPHAIAKVGIDVDLTPRQAGYVSGNASVTGISLTHDEGTGGNTAGGYGNFPLFPLTGCGFESCPVGIEARKALRAAGADAARPGYFTTTFTNNIKLEATSTRRAGLIRFTFPEETTNFVVVDLTNDLQRSFEGGSIQISPDGRVLLGGTYLQSYGPSNYTVYACYDFAPPDSTQVPVQFGTYQSISVSAPTNITVTPGSTSLSFVYTSSPSKIQAGGLLAFNNSVVLARFGVSFISSAQACANAEEEVGAAWGGAWDTVQGESEGRWEDVLRRVVIDTGKEDADVVELLYSSLYRAALVPANLTGENPYWDSSYPFYDALFCSWDTFRTVHPLLSITSPRQWADIVNAYIDGWRATGQGYVQGGSDGMPVLGDFAVKYGAVARELGVPTDDLYQALVDTAENTPPNWYTVGRQNTAWKTFGYIPTNWTDPSGATGLPTREASRTLEYALGDFAVRQAALALGKPQADAEKYANRSMGFVNVWDPNVTSDGFLGFAQRRYANGTFAYSPPDACSPVDPTPHSCARGTDNDVGFYECKYCEFLGKGGGVVTETSGVASSWEYSFFAPHSMATLVGLMGGPETFVSRLDNYFAKGYFYAGNEPSFELPWLYHYAGRPDLSALRIRNVVYNNFGTGIGGIPGNDDSGAMAALLTFHLLGLYPVPASRQLLIGTPFVSAFNLTNNAFNTVTKFVVENFDSAALTATPPNGSSVYVSNITINGKASQSLCWISFDDVVGGGEIVITLDSDAATAASRGCGTGDRALPDSLGTGGFGAL
ncbi:hypothetical protein GLOTRDRAFT_49038 [Gloeophyllum trabeum ATCC 11539]|uniref:Glycoside hydrolase family 92 protein n=1 Tax=Gloeophyllum trabeum (strain ATCC 11539 / FP-39264 / Madison 617) TaxID=670483 RepID=S7PUW7_GLOTA|nr:uncharacterized protein GLOTRDRAFT_49038 [Gloeophyllum trabeum ATCC 11539]EPQ51223.1 hypothetical protein GLOTRDRAFT_49038 [Gloeophyllum trabeum ATCC 11539]